MDYSLIGKKIKELRKIVGLTQGELSEGICTQALISRIEKGDIYPSATTLYQVSKKLGVDVNYFFEIGTTPRLDYIKEVEKQLRKLRIKLKYEDMMEVVRAEEKNPLYYKDNSNLQLLYWHKGIYLFEVKKDFQRAFAILHEAYHMTAMEKKAISEREIEILLTIGVFEYNLKNHEAALKYYEDVKAALQAIEQLSDKSIKTRLLYNMARLSTHIGNYKESRKYCLEAVKWCIEEEHLWGLGELYYHIGYNYELEKELPKALQYIEKAIIIFEMRKNYSYHSILLKKREEVRAGLESLNRYPL
jgi:transcriptional regulator with XRE-family HTH domain